MTGLAYGCCLNMRDRRSYGILILAVVGLLAMIAAACGRSGKSGRPVVAVSTPAIGRIVDEISGGDVETVVLLPAGSDPENYEPDMSTMKRASEAVAFLSLNTPGFERRLSEQLADALPDMKSVDLSAGVPVIDDEDGSYGHSSGDPHLLSAPENARIIARNAADALAELYPEQGKKFRDRHATLDTLLAKRDEETRELLEGRRGESFVETHPALSYFAREYGLRQIALEREGKEVSPRQLEERMKEAAAGSPRVLFYEQAHNPGQALHIARLLGVRAVAVDFNAADFIEQYVRVAQEIKK